MALVGYEDGGGLPLRWIAAGAGSRGIGISPFSDMPSSDVSGDTPIIESSESESPDVSDALEGAYSCLRGDEERRLFVLPPWSFDPFGVRTRAACVSFCRGDGEVCFRGEIGIVIPFTKADSEGNECLLL